MTSINRLRSYGPTVDASFLETKRTFPQKATTCRTVPALLLSRAHILLRKRGKVKKVWTVFPLRPTILQACPLSYHNVVPSAEGSEEASPLLREHAARPEVAPLALDAKRSNPGRGGLPDPRSWRCIAARQS